MAITQLPTSKELVSPNSKNGNFYLLQFLKRLNPVVYHNQLLWLNMVLFDWLNIHLFGRSFQ